MYVNAVSTCSNTRCFYLPTLCTVLKFEKVLAPLFHLHTTQHLYNMK